MIEVKELYKYFGENKAVNDLSFEVKDGEIYGLIGPNGSGKSTTMEIISGIIKPTKGEVLVNNIDVINNSNDVKKILGYVPESPVLYESLTPIELFNFIGGLRNIQDEKLIKRVNYFIKAFDLEKYLDQYIGTLSFGTKQKVSIITAFLHNPNILIMDEAMNGLDPKVARILREILLQFKNKGKNMIFSTHVLPLAEMICDRVGVIFNGKIIAEGTIQELKEKSQEGNLEDIFLKLTRSQDEVYDVVKALQEAD